MAFTKADRLKRLKTHHDLLTNTLNELNRVANIFGDTVAISQVRSHLDTLLLQTLTKLIKAGYKGD